MLPAGLRSRTTPFRWLIFETKIFLIPFAVDSCGTVWPQELASSTAFTALFLLSLRTARQVKRPEISMLPAGLRSRIQHRSYCTFLLSLRTARQNKRLICKHNSRGIAIPHPLCLQSASYRFASLTLLNPSQKVLLFSTTHNHKLAVKMRTRINFSVYILHLFTINPNSSVFYIFSCLAS